jgi:DNA-binding beta-propeller fold protein YncE
LAFDFDKLGLNAQLFFWEMAAFLVKFAIIIGTDAARGFSHFINQHGAHKCPYSYADYRRLQKRLRTFSLSGLFTLAAAGAIVGLVLNLIFGGRLPGFAATFGWVQTKWDATPTPGFVAVHDQEAWGNASTTQFEALDSLVTINNPAPGDSYLSEGTTSSNITITDDTASSTGFNYPLYLYDNTELNGEVGASSSVQLKALSTKTFNLGDNVLSTASFSAPNAVALDAVHNKIFMTDTKNNRIVRFDSGGGGTTFGANFQAFGTFGAGTGEFWEPEGIVIDNAAQKMFVSDTRNNRLVSCGYSDTTFGDNCEYLTGLSQPSQIDINVANSKIFVANTSANNIVVVSYAAGLVVDTAIAGTPLAFINPNGVTFDSANNKVYVADTLRSRIVKFDYDMSSKVASNFGALSYSSSELPRAIFVDPTNNVAYASDDLNNITAINTGTFSFGEVYNIPDSPMGMYADSAAKRLYIANLGNNKLSIVDAKAPGKTFGQNLAELGSSGTGVSQYNFAKDVGYDSDTYKIYVVDNTRVIRYDSGYGGTTFGANWEVFSSSTNAFHGLNGIYIDKTHQKIYLSDSDRIVRINIANFTSGEGWQAVTGLVTDSILKDIYVDEAAEVLYSIKDYNSSSINILTMNCGAGNFGTDQHFYGGIGAGAGNFNIANSLTVDPLTKRVFVVDGGNNRVVNFTLNPSNDSIQSWHEVGGFSNPKLQGIWFDARNSKVYVGDFNNKSVHTIGLDENNNFTAPANTAIKVDDSSDFRPIELLGDVSNNKLLIVDEISSGLNYRIVKTDISATVHTFALDGTYTTGALDTLQKNLGWGSVSWAAMTRGQTVTIKARSASTSDDLSAIDWASCSNLANTQDLAGYACVHPHDRFIQFQATMHTNDETISPLLNDIQFDFDYYPSDQSLTSVVYDSTDAGNVLGALSWMENQNDPFIYGNLSLRSATSTADIGAAGWQTVNLGSACTKSAVSGTVSCNFSQLKADLPSLYDGNDDRFFQYKIHLLSPGDVAPTINSVNVNYIINIKPDVEITNTPVQSLDGTVQVDFRVRDIDTNTGSTTGKVAVGLEYWNGAIWAKASTTDYKAGSNFGLLDVETATTSDWRNYSIVWLASSSYPGQYYATSGGFKVRISAYDGEIANNTGYGTSSDLRLDTQAPASTSVRINASQTTGAGQVADLDFSAIDDSGVEFKLGLDPNLADAGAWAPYIASTTIILPSDPDSVYVQFKDAYQNMTPIISATHPVAPSNEIIRDITNQSAEIFQLFLAWKKAPDQANFKQYVIYRSEDNGATYQQYAAIASSTINYFFDNTFEFSGGVVIKKYFYRIAVENKNGDISHYNLILADIPDGQGVNINPPVIATSSIQSFATSAQMATIVWDTNIEANSAVGYSTNPDDFTNIVGIATMRDNNAGFGQHRIVLTGLSASTTYYYQVRSTDAFGFTITQDRNDAGVPYSFTTLPGPVISNVSTSSLTKTSVTVNWNTSLPADSTVTYSASTSFANALQVTNSGTLELNHSVNLDGLESNTKYYYYVSSKDADGYESIGRNFVDGEYVNYEFTTLADAAFPNSTSTTCTKSGDSALLVSWLTEKPAVSRLLYGVAPSNYASSTNFTSSYDTAQNALVGSLLASTTYYFVSVNTDQTNNVSTSSEFTCTTNEALISKAESDAKVQNAYNTGKADGAVPPPSTGGGGMLIIDKNDKVAPIISDVRVLDVATSTAKIMWKTNEGASSFVEFGPSINYDSNWGRPEITKNHISEIRGLQPNTVYHYRLSSADGSGNLTQTEDKVIKTVSMIEELAGNGSTSATSTGESTTSLRDFIEKILANASLDGFDGSLMSQYNLLQKLAEAMPTPVFTANPIAVTTMDSATITWQTDKDTNSLVALATDDVFALNKNKKEPYYRLEGEPYQFTRSHKLVLSDLKPGTLYHYQARSRAQLGLSVVSRDFTFRTKDEGLAITNFNSEIKSKDEVLFKWLTSAETDAQLKFTPYHNNQLAVDEAKIVEDRKLAKNHELSMKELQPGTVYQVEMSGLDYNGKKVSKTIPTFATAKDLEPPKISQIQTESALSQGKTKTVQTIISWTTNEPTVCEVSYEKGVSDKADLAEKAPLEASYSKKHVLVLTKFESGQVYSFRIKAIDSSGNNAVSDAHTILTPKQREGVFELIMRSFESTFGWLRDVK